MITEEMEWLSRKTPAQKPVPVDAEKSWVPLVDESRILLGKIRSADKEAIWARYHFGKNVVKWQNANKYDEQQWHGSKMVERLAIEVQMHPRIIYQCMAVAKKFPRDKDFREYVETLESKNYLTWGHVRTKTLPPEESDDTQFGGPDGQIDHILHVTEASQRTLERYIKRGVPEEFRGEVDGALIHMAENLVSMSKALDQRPVFQEPQIEQEVEVDVNEEDRTWTQSMFDKFHSFIRQMPCCCCERGGMTEVAHYPHTRAVSFDHKAVIPLCTVCHRFQHDDPDKFKEHWDVKIMEWMGQWVSRFWEEEFVKNNKNDKPRTEIKMPKDDKPEELGIQKDLLKLNE